jgi:hypothetical protein
VSWGVGVAEKARSTGAVYRDEAADLMAAAARGNSRQAPPDLELTARRAAPDIKVETKRPEAKRPLPYPEPVGRNDNSHDDVSEDFRPAPRAPRRRPNILQFLARVLIAPLYLAVAAAAVAMIALFVRGFLA